MIASLENTFQVKLTRREFLMYLGVVFIGITGIPALLKTISNVNPNSSIMVKKSKPRSFGSGAYGV